VLEAIENGERNTTKILAPLSEPVLGA